MTVAELELGPHKGVIVAHRSKMIGDKLAIVVRCDVNGETADATIYMTEKALGMSRRALKVCGFDIDKNDLSMLDIKPTLLAGNPVPLMVDEWNGKTQIKIDIDGRAEKAALEAMTKQLRAVKKSNNATAGAAASGGGAEAAEDFGDIPF